MRYDDEAIRIINAAFDEAVTKKHEFCTIEHLLYSALFFEESAEILEECGADIQTLQNNLEQYFKDYLLTIEHSEPVQSISLYNLRRNVENHAMSSQQEIITIGDLLAAIFDQPESFAAYYLSLEGVTKLDILRYISDIYEDNEIENDDSSYEEEVSAVDKYCINLTKKAEDGTLDPLIGREDIVKRTLQVLARRQKNNPIQVGEAGVGKTAIAEGIASLIISGNVPDFLKDSKLFYLDMGSVIAGTKYRGDFEERLKKVLNELIKRKNSIIYIDEIHTIVGAGAVSGSSMDASNILKPFLAKGELRCIGSTTHEEYKKYFSKDKALSRRFQKIDIEEPSLNEAILIIQGLKSKYEEYHNVKYSNAAIEAAVNLSAKYIQDRHLPDKAIDLIDEAGALMNINRENNIIINIEESDIEKAVSLVAKIPEKSVASDEKKLLLMLESNLESKIFGQNHAVKSVVNAIKRSRAGFNDDNKPIASLLFVGPTGVGKTELSKELAKELNIPLIRFDMSEYQEKNSVTRLIGAPPGYVGYEEGGKLVDEIKKNPYSVLLLDEIEKAHPDIYNVLLQVMDYASLTDHNDRKADFKNVILIMTSNAGASEVGKSLVGFGNRINSEDVIKNSVKKIFAPEFRNRLNAIVTFNHLNLEMAESIASKQLNEFSEKLKTKKIILSFDSTLIKWVASKGFSPIFGAREIQRIIEDKVKAFLVEEILFGKLANGGNASISINNDTPALSIK